MDNSITIQTAEVKLSEYDFIVAIDASGSMGEETCKDSGKTRWDAMQESVLAFTRDVEKLDSDGIGVVLFSGSHVEAFDNVTSDKVRTIFAGRSPRGSTPLHTALAECLKLAAKSNKKAFVMVFTDGVPDDAAAVERVICEAANALVSDDALTFLFVQVGNDASATKYLQHLDDDIRGAKFDIVDTKTIEQAEAFPTTTALVLHAIND